MYSIPPSPLRSEDKQRWDQRKLRDCKELDFLSGVEELLDVACTQPLSDASNPQPLHSRVAATSRQSQESTSSAPSKRKFLRRRHGTLMFKNRYELEQERKRKRELLKKQGIANGSAKKKPEMRALEQWRERQRKLDAASKKQMTVALAQKSSTARMAAMKGNSASLKRLPRDGSAMHRLPQSLLRSASAKLDSRSVPLKSVSATVVPPLDLSSVSQSVETQGSQRLLASASQFEEVGGDDLDASERSSVAFWSDATLPGMVQLPTARSAVSGECKDEESGGDSENEWADAELESMRANGELAADLDTSPSLVAVNCVSRKKPQTTGSFARYNIGTMAAVSSQRPAVAYPKYTHHHHTALAHETKSADASAMYHSVSRKAAQKQATVFTKSKRDRLAMKHLMRTATAPQRAAEKSFEAQRRQLKEQMAKLADKFNEARRLKQHSLAEFRKYQQMIQDFEEKTKDDLEQFEAFKRKEVAKLEKRKSEVDKKQRSVLQIPSRKERDQITKLNEENEMLRKSEEQSRNRMSARIDRLKMKLRRVTQENEELNGQLKVLRTDKSAVTGGTELSAITGKSGAMRRPTSSRGSVLRRTATKGGFGTKRPSTGEMLPPNSVSNLSGASIKPWRRRKGVRRIEAADYISDETGVKTVVKRIRHPTASGKPRVTFSDERPATADVRRRLREMHPSEGNAETSSWMATFEMGSKKAATSLRSARPMASHWSDDENVSEMLYDTGKYRGTEDADDLSTDEDAKLEDSSSDECAIFGSGPFKLPPIPDRFEAEHFTESQTESEVMCRGSKPTHRMQHADGKLEELFGDGSKRILFPNGTEKVIFKAKTDGRKQFFVKFPNDDTKKVLETGEEVYFYRANDITHVTKPDGTQLFYFGKQQQEIHFDDGTKHILFADGSKKYIHPNGNEELIAAPVY